MASAALLADGLHDSRVGVAQSVYAQTGDEIQVAFAVKVEKENALAAGDYKRVSAVGLEQKLAFALDDFFAGAHRGNHDSTGFALCGEDVGNQSANRHLNQTVTKYHNTASKKHIFTAGLPL